MISDAQMFLVLLYGLVGIGFILGVVASVFLSLIAYLTAKIIERRKINNKTRSRNGK